jgi:hypothetical protein
MGGSCANLRFKELGVGPTESPTELPSKVSMRRALNLTVLALQIIRNILKLSQDRWIQWIAHAGIGFQIGPYSPCNGLVLNTDSVLEVVFQSGWGEVGGGNNRSLDIGDVNLAMEARKVDDFGIVTRSAENPQGLDVERAPKYAIAPQISKNAQSRNGAATGSCQRVTDPSRLPGFYVRGCDQDIVFG